MVRKVIFCMCMTMLPLTAFPQAATVVKQGAKTAGKILRNTIKEGKNSAKTESKIAGRFANTLRTKNGHARISGGKFLSNPDVLPKNISKGQIHSITLYLRDRSYGSSINVTDDIVLKVYNLCARKGLTGKDIKQVFKEFAKYSDHIHPYYKGLIKKSNLRETEAKELQLLKNLFTDSKNPQRMNVNLPKELDYYKPSKEVSIGEFAHIAIRHSNSSQGIRNRTMFTDDYLKKYLQADIVKVKRSPNRYIVNNEKGHYILRYDKCIGKDVYGNEIKDVMIYMKDGLVNTSFPWSEGVKREELTSPLVRQLYSKIPVTSATW